MMLPVTWTPELELDCAYYDEEGSESLGFDSLDEYLDNYIQNGAIESIRELIEDDAKLEVFGYKRMMPSRDECKFLERLFERVDEDRGDPDGEHVSLTNESWAILEAAENAFIDLFLSHYDPWAYKDVVKIIVPFRKWWTEQSEETRAELADCTCGDDCAPPCLVHATLRQFQDYNGGIGVME